MFVSSVEQAAGNHGGSFCVVDGNGLYFSSLFPAVSWHLRCADLTNQPLYVDVPHLWWFLFRCVAVDSFFSLVCGWLCLFVFGGEEMKADIAYIAILVTLLFLFCVFQNSFVI